MKEEILIEKSKYSDAQIMSILEPAENGVPVAAHAEESMQNDWLKEALGKSGKAVSKREMAEWAVRCLSASIALASRAFSISETCYRYQPKLNDENQSIADWPVALTNAKNTWGLGLCFLHLRNVKRFSWNHKRVYRIHRKLELNMRIKPTGRSQIKPALIAGEGQWSITFSPLSHPKSLTSGESTFVTL